MQEPRKAPGRLSYANVMSTLAVFLLVGGGVAFGATRLAKNSVGPKQLKKSAVTTAKLKKGAVNGAKVKDGSLTGTELADGTVTGLKVQDGSLTGADLAAGTLPAVPDVTGMALDKDCVPVAPVPSGVIAVQMGSACKVIFPHSILSCAATATVAFRTTGLLIVAERSAQTRRAPALPNEITIITSVNGTFTSLPFDLTVVC